MYKILISNSNNFDISNPFTENVLRYYDCNFYFDGEYLIMEGDEDEMDTYIIPHMGIDTDDLIELN